MRLIISFIFIFLFSESLRKYPPVTDLNRVSENDYKVEGTNHTIKSGTLVFVPVMALQHDPEYYPNPEKFDPDRFTPEEIAKRNAYTFLSFGAGPRACIGLRFGIMQAKIGLALMLQNFKFEGCNKTVLTPASGVYINVTNIICTKISKL